MKDIIFSAEESGAHFPGSPKSRCAFRPIAFASSRLKPPGAEARSSNKAEGEICSKRALVKIGAGMVLKIKSKEDNSQSESCSKEMICAPVKEASAS